MPEPIPQVEMVIDGGDHHVRADLDLASAHTLVTSLAELLAPVPTRHRPQQPRVFTP